MKKYTYTIQKCTDVSNVYRSIYFKVLISIAFENEYLTISPQCSFLTPPPPPPVATLKTENQRFLMFSRAVGGGGGGGKTIFWRNGLFRHFNQENLKIGTSFWRNRRIVKWLKVFKNGLSKICLEYLTQM